MDSTNEPLPPAKTETGARKPWSAPKVLVGTVSDATWSDSNPHSDAGHFGYGTGS